jgi:hypothetical protein
MRPLHECIANKTSHHHKTLQHTSNHHSLHQQAFHLITYFQQDLISHLNISDYCLFQTV